MWKNSWPILRNNSANWLEGLIKTMKNLLMDGTYLRFETDLT
jgi:hypothetical protein